MIKITVSGNVGKDPRTSNGHVFFSVASNDKQKDGSKVTTWVDVRCFASANIDTSKVARGVYVTADGFGKLKEYNGKTSLEVVAKSIEVGFPVDGARAASPRHKVDFTTDPAGDFDPGYGQDDEIPF